MRESARRAATDGEDLTGHLVGVLLLLRYPAAKLGAATEAYYRQHVTRQAEQAGCRERNLTARMLEDQIRAGHETSPGGTNAGITDRDSNGTSRVH